MLIIPSSRLSRSLTRSLAGVAITLVSVEAVLGAVASEASLVVVRPDLASGLAPDSPSARVDPNLPTSRFTGVVSIFLDLGGGQEGLCTGTLIGSDRVLTAGHCLDGFGSGDIDGQVSYAPSQVKVLINYDNWDAQSPGTVPVSTYSIDAQGLFINPAFGGFDGSLNGLHDDIAVITLAQPVPAGVATYPLFLGPLSVGDEIVMVGYGFSGTGLTPQTVPFSYEKKRTGGNVVDFMLTDDEGGGFDEVYVWDFDAPTEDAARAADFETYGFDLVNGPLGGPSLGNDVEAGGLGGDSGGPAFLDIGGQLFLAGVHTFAAGFDAGQPAFGLGGYFGSGGGGVFVEPYAEWAMSVNASGGVVPEASNLLAGGVIAVAAVLFGGRRYRRFGR